jgi:hypothetical protein
MGSGVVLPDATDHGSVPRAAAVAATLADLLVYVVVLNVADQVVPSVISESFTDSLLTALLLKAVLELVLAAKQTLLRHVRTAGRLMTVAGLVTLWLVMVLSKFVVLEAVDLVLGGRVSLGGFWSVTGLVVVLTLARAVVRLGLARVLDTGRPVPRDG